MKDSRKKNIPITNSETEESKFLRYQRLVELSSDILIEMDMENHLIYANPSLKHVLGYSLSEFNQVGVNDFIHSDDLPKLDTSFSDFRDNKISEFTHTFRGKHILGHFLWLQGSFSKNIDSNGQIESILGIIRKVNEQNQQQLYEIFESDEKKRNQDKFIESEMRFREVLVNSQDISYRLNLKSGLYDYISPIIEKITGYSVKNARLDFIQQHINQADMIRNQQEVKKKLSTTTDRAVSMQNVARFRCADGQIKWFSDKFTYYRDEYGKPLHSVGSLRDITSSIEQMDALRLSEERFKEILEGSRTISYHLNLKTEEYEYVGPVLEEITGYKHEKITHPFVLAHIHPDDAQKNMAELNFHLTNSTALKINLVQDARFLCKNGEYKWFRDALTFIRDENGDPIASIGSIQDITESKLLNLAFKKSEERYRNIIENFPFPIAITDRSNQNLYINPKFTEIFGYTIEDVPTTEDWAQLAYPDETYRRTVLTNLPEVTDKLSFPRMNQVHCKDGDIRSIIFRDININSEEFITIYEDVTEKLEIEEEIKLIQQESTQKLEESEKKFREVLEHSSDAVYKFNCQTGTYDYMSPVIKKIFGYSHNEIGAMSREQINQLIHPDDLKNFRFDEESMELNPNLQIPHIIEYRSLSKQGEYFWIGDSHTIYRNREGIPQFIIGSLRNISGIKNREKKLRQIVKEKNVLLKEVHHRVKNNLQIIASMLNLQSGYFKNPDFTRIVQNTKNRIESILIVYESLYQSDNFESINFVRFIQKLIRNVFRSYHVDPRRITNIVDVEDVNISLDQSIPITLIINEVVSNSLKYAFPGNKEGKISIKFRHHPNFNILTISDNGIGIKESVDLNEPKTFGLQLISILSKQIDGQLSLNRKLGTKYILKIPK